MPLPVVQRQIPCREPKHSTYGRSLFVREMDAQVRLRHAEHVGFDQRIYPTEQLHTEPKAHVPHPCAHYAVARMGSPHP